MSKSIEELKSLTTQIRRDILRMVHAVNSGHPGGSLGCTEFSQPFTESNELQTSFHNGR
jgi:transketolase N-terminal domain/subunit